MRRAAVHWGIGRYLYRMPTIWAPVDKDGKLTERPTIPKQFLPTKGVQKITERGREAA